MLKRKYKSAFNFLGGYFHQDFSDEFVEPEAAVEKFIEDSDLPMRISLVKELRQIMTEFDESELDDVVFELGCYYSPQKDRNTTMKAWLEQVISQIEHPR